MSPLHHILRQAQRRALINHALHRIGVGLAAGTAAAIVLLLFDRLTNIPVPQIGYWLLPIAGAVAGAIHSILLLPDRFALAVQLDRVLRLKDRIGTAATLAHLRTLPSIDPDFAELVNRDAQRLAETLDVRAATPIRATRIWALLLPLAGALIAGYVWLPHINLVERMARAQSPSDIQRQQFAQVEAQQIASAIDQTIADLPRDEFLDEAARSKLDALDRLAQQLAEQPVPPEELAKARDESAAHLNELAERLAQQSQRELAAAQELARRFQGMDKTGAPQPPMSAEDFTEALTRGDFGAAAQQLQELLDNPSLPESQRQQTAEHLRELASHLEKELSQMTPEQLQQMREQLEQALRDQGVDQQTIREMLDNPPPQEQVEEQLKQQNVDEEVARELARDIEQLQEQREIEEQTQRDAQQVQDALRKAAEQLETQRQQEQRGTGQPPADSSTTPESDQTAQRDASQQRNAPRPDGESQPPQQPQRQQPPRPGESSAQQQQQEQQQQQQSQPRDQSQPSQSESGEQPQQQQGDQQQGREQRESERSSQPDSTQSTKPDPSARESDAKPDQQPQPGSQQPATQQSQQMPADSRDQSSESDQTDAASQTAPSGESQQQQRQQRPQTPSEALRQLAERQSTAEDRRNASERLKQAARELSQRMTPEERERWAQQWRREQGESQDKPPQPFGAASPENFAGDSRRPDGSPDQQRPPQFQTDDLDLRDAKTADQIIAQWLGDDAPTEGGAQRAQGAPPAVRQAREVAERAVNESAVQKRYHRAIQRYFGRLNETASKAAAEPSPKSD